MRAFFILLPSLLFLYSCSEPDSDLQASFVTTLGKDTLVIERFDIQPEKVEATVLIRSPRTQYIQHTFWMTPEGNFKKFTSLTYHPKDVQGKPIMEQTIELEGDSLLLTTKRDTTVRTSKLAYEASLMPWVDMVHWPYEVAVRQMISRDESSVDQRMLGGRRPATFEIRLIEEDSISIKHPSRGTMYARIDEHGALQYYDATSTTRKLILSRVAPLDMEALAIKYADRSIGSLSGAANEEMTVHEAGVRLRYGQPARRGRELFGGIVPWGERWRTGANRATHFKTDKTLKVGELILPAAEYTLFTIPEPDGGILIINSQTGQNGNRYDQSRDFGRIAMTRTQNEEMVELFTIEAKERGEKGVLQLKWGNDIFEVEFEVLPGTNP